MSVGAAAARLLAATTPTLPADKVPDVNVTPGVVGFIAIACVAVATIFLIIDMVRRTRRTQYRAQIREQLAEEARGTAGAPSPRDGDASDDQSAPVD